MTSRELQARNIANRLIDLSIEYKLPIVIMGKSYKPGIKYTDGSYSLLIGSFIGEVDYDINEKPAVFLLGHRNVFNDTQFPEGSIVLDPWRERINKDTIY
jgi:UDPglucose 6-dehydrogenase